MSINSSDEPKANAYRSRDLVRAIPDLADLPIIGILRDCDPGASSSVVGAAAEEGIRVFEVTLDSREALWQIATLTADYPRLVVGAGSVINVAHVSAVIDAGASFVVSPVSVPTIIQECQRLGKPIIPGASTPTEIQVALSHGATAVKVFPAELLGGPAYLRTVSSPLHRPELVPTGGVTPENAQEYLDAGAVALGVGSSLFPSISVGNLDTSAIANVARRWAQVLR